MDDHAKKETTMTVLGKFAATDVLALFIFGIAYIWVNESRRKLSWEAKERLESILGRTFLGLLGFGILLILLAIWGVR